MSRIYFHSETDGDSLVSGAERAMMASLCSKISVAILDVKEKTDPIIKLIDPAAYIHASLNRPLSGRVRDDFDLWFRHGMEEKGFIVDGKPVSTFTVSLNTALAVGNDSLRLAARLHGQCEIYCWVDGPNRAWLASIIEDGLQAGVFRGTLRGHPLGWESVVTHLRKRNTEPVVCSYSVCEQFPNAGIAGWESKDDGDDWYELDSGKQWRLAMAGLRAVPMMEMKPENFAQYRFSDGTTAMSLRAKAEEEFA